MPGGRTADTPSPPHAGHVSRELERTLLHTAASVNPQEIPLSGKRTPTPKGRCRVVQILGGGLPGAREGRVGFESLM